VPEVAVTRLGALFVIVVALAASCGRRHDTGAIELAEQPIVENGVRSTYSIDLAAIEPSARGAARERAVRAIRIRLQLAKIPAHVSVRGEQLVIDLQVSDPETLERASELIARTGRFELQFAEPGSAYMTALAEFVRSDPEAASFGVETFPDKWITEDGVAFKDVALRARGDAACAAIERYVDGLASRAPRLAVPDDRVIACEPHLPVRGVVPPPPPSARSYLLVKRREIPAATIERTTVEVDEDSSQWIVRIELDRAGADELAKATETHVGRKLAFVVDGRVNMAPIIASRVAGGRVSLLCGPKDDERAEAEARLLAIVLRSGPLPGPVRLETRARLVGGVAQYDPN
jgi:preprotein translocase subunit SecD